MKILCASNFRLCTVRFSRLTAFSIRLRTRPALNSCLLFMKRKPLAKAYLRHCQTAIMGIFFGNGQIVNGF